MTAAVRVFRREPGFVLLAVLTMALGTGAITALFGLTYSVLLKPLPWAESDRLVRVTESRQGGEPRVKGTVSNAAYNAWYAEPTLIESIGGWRNVPTTVVVNGGEPVRLQTAAVTPSLFAVLRVRPLVGRVFVDDDGKPGGSFPSREVAVLSYGFWRERFGSDPNAIGTAITIGGRPHTIVGVTPDGFAFPDPLTRVWTPWAVPSVLGDQGVRRMTIFSALARLRSGVTPSQATAEGTARARNGPDPGLAAVAMFGGNGLPEVTATPAIEMLTAEVRPALLLMSAAVLLLLITSTANVASLQLARATTRRREIAIRAAVGASTGRLTRQLVAESVIIGIAGGVTGLAFAAALARVVPSLLPADFPRLHDITIDVPVLIFSAIVSLAAGVACSVLPALHARRLDVTRVITEGAFTSGGAFGRVPGMRARSAIMVGQIAVACVLLIGAALLTRSFVAMLNADRGYDPRNLLTARLPLPADFAFARRTDLLNTIAERMRSMPGVVDVAYGNALPLLASGGYRAFRMRPPSDPANEVDVNAMQRVVSPGYFGALGLRLVEGRIFNDADTMTSRQVIVVDRSFAARYLGDRPIGTVVPNLGVCRDDNDRWEVVGVVEDMRQGGLTDPAQPELFMPYAQVACAAAVPEPIVVVKAADDPATHAPALRSLLRELAPSMAFDSMMTMEERVATTLARPRLYVIAIGGFAVFALAIAAVGLFGVLSYSVAQRAREIGVRSAIGARPIDILMLVLRQVATVAAAGITAGIALAFAAGRWVAALLWGVDAQDPVSFTLVPIVLVAVTAIASAIPAMRAARTDPVQVLRAH